MSTFFRKKEDAVIRGLCAYLDEYSTFSHHNYNLSLLQAISQRRVSMKEGYSIGNSGHSYTDSGWSINDDWFQKQALSQD